MTADGSTHLALYFLEPAQLPAAPGKEETISDIGKIASTHSSLLRDR
jgi:hypothetical protein